MNEEIAKEFKKLNISVTEFYFNLGDGVFIGFDDTSRMYVSGKVISGRVSDVYHVNNREHAVERYLTLKDSLKNKPNLDNLINMFNKK